MVFIGMEGSDFCFLNPHREADGQQDYVLLSEADILSRIEGESHIGYLKPRKESHDTDNTMASVASANALLSETLAVLEQYKKRMTAFCQDLPSHAEIMAIRDSLLRPIALEMPVMMELTRETALQSKLLLFQKQILGLFRSESGNTTEKPDPALLHEILEDYQSLVLIFNRKSN